MTSSLHRDPAAPAIPALCPGVHGQLSQSITELLGLEGTFEGHLVQPCSAP